MSSEYYLTTNQGTRGRKALMEAIANKIYEPNKRFTQPEGVIEVTVEKETIPLQLASEFTPAHLKMTGLFKKGTEPTEVSPRFNSLENPSNGKAEVNGKKIILSWTPISTPMSIDTKQLNEYYNQGYGQWAQKYYNQRIGFNNSSMGTQGYQIYLKNSDGSLQSVGFTNDNHFTYTASGSATNYTFVIKSAYSIFKNNMSSGLTINSKVSASTDPETNELALTLNGSKTICAKIGEPFVDIKNPLKVVYGDEDVTSKSTITPSTVDTSSKKSVNLTYKVTYNGISSSISRIINVCNSCNSDGTCKS